MTTATLPRTNSRSAWLTMARISNSPTVVSNVLAGTALSTIAPAASPLVLLAVSMVSFYTAGMLLNDICDMEWDRERRPDRPLIAGTVSRRAAIGATAALFAIGLVLAAAAGARPFFAAVVLSGLIVLYDVWHKSNPLSPLIMAGCRLMVYVAAFVTFAWPPTLALVLGGAALVLYLIAVTAIAKRGAPGRVVAPMLAGISLLDAAVIAIMQGPIAWIGIAVLCFVLTLFFQRYVEGT